MTLYKRLTSSNVASQITGNSVQFTTATFFGISGFDNNGSPLNNTGPVYLGFSNTGQMPIQLATGSFFNWELTPKVQGEDLSNWYLKGAAGDGVYVVYYP